MLLACTDCCQNCFGGCTTGIRTDVPFSDFHPPADNLVTAIREYWEDSETESDRENGEQDDKNDH
ncbi:hypothetical protein K438DRAFT_1986180 [Mycena galopus ATCC 62051]|nr:hypothetical protein K438DRAFT_1986180 [Mycena galopus ATCC 62051]